MLLDGTTHASTTTSQAILLKESIDRFLASTSTSSSSSCDFSGFRAIFSRLLQSTPDPPLETLWFYSAVVYHDSPALDRVAALKDLLRLLITCSACSGAAKSVAVVAPVVAFLCPLVVENVDGACDLAKGVIGYLGVCTGKGPDSGGGGGTLVPCCFRDLIRVWMAPRKYGEFFPLVSDDVRRVFSSDECSVNYDYLAAVVIAEVFLLKLYVKSRGGSGERLGMRQELKLWAVGSITGFQNRSFFEILLKLMLESSFPSILALNAEDAAFLRTVLCDALILVEYSFLQPKNMGQFNESFKSLTLIRLIVAHEAIQDARKSKDQGKAISYINAFSRWSLLSALIKWISTQTGESGSPYATTPQALLKWLFRIEDHGLKLFDFEISKYRIKFFDEMDIGSKDQAFILQNNKADNDLFFFDNEGEGLHDDSDDHEMALIDDAFMSAARSMSNETNSRKKRKEMKDKESGSQVKFIKYRIQDTSARDYFSASKEDMSSGSEVDNPLSDEEMEDIEA